MKQNQLHLNQSCDREYMIYVAYLDDSLVQLFGKRYIDRKREKMVMV